MNINIRLKVWKWTLNLWFSSSLESEERKSRT